MPSSYPTTVPETETALPPPGSDNWPALSVSRIEGLVLYAAPDGALCDFDQTAEIELAPDSLLGGNIVVGRVAKWAPVRWRDSQTGDGNVCWLEAPDYNAMMAFIVNEADNPEASLDLSQAAP